MSPSDSQPDRLPLPLEFERQIDRLSKEFRRAWQSGQLPRIEDYLDRFPTAGQLRLLEELLVVEFDLREQAGEPLDVDAYRQRFPGNDAVDAALALRAERARDDLPRTASTSSAREVEEDAQPLPQRIGRFEIRCRLGKGGFGVVYLAHDPGLDRLVALKVPRPELLATGQQRENFLHEARTTAKLKHAALVTVYDVQQDGEQIYIVQEYIEGQNLAHWATAQPRSWKDVVRCLIEIVTAIGGPTGVV